ncbi:allene oxide synthase [Ricinus communis]|uniref:Cytochrome P450, putative n=1 Tax=Ricinus communis TaxID=3988 RepID=B9R7M7_RICCO|nr:allene oxide synthase [Ricinus communis]EEF52507.1 cytochrome P450, putative [Ricinus communis]|eukprot:XP_002510320.1 allene oxide synthase [Ricinus communis]
MASSSIPSAILQTQVQTLKHSTRRSSVSPITASVSEKPSTTNSPLIVSPTESSKLPIRKIPGDYGLPFFGPIKDRLDYFYNQGREEFFKSRSQKYQSTVYRTNMPPGPFISKNPHVVVVLDGKSFPVLFDVTKVEKKDLFTGTYMPSVDLTGGYRVLSYLDPSEQKHTQLKQLLFYLLKSRRDHVIPEFASSYTELFDGLEKDLASKGKVSFNDPGEQAAFSFLGKCYFGTNPVDSKVGTDGPSLIAKWVLFQLAPILTLGLPAILEEPLIHTFRLPAFLIKKDYKRLYDYFNSSAGSLLDEAEKMGISRDEACHNLLFATCFNTFGGMKIFFPNILKWIGRAGVALHTELAKEIRSVLNGGEVTMSALEQMPLMKSAVYEAFRIEPPVPAQYGKAKRDIVIESHDAAYEVKEGEMIFGYQPFATKDPKIFDRPEEYVPDRFVGEGEKLLQHVLWSNGPETEHPTIGNKQCAGKDFVVFISRLFVVEIFRRYDSFEIEVASSTLGSSVTITSLKRATF